jgi:hypothetical protein
MGAHAPPQGTHFFCFGLFFLYIKKLVFPLRPPLREARVDKQPRGDKQEGDFAGAASDVFPSLVPL